MSQPEILRELYNAILVLIGRIYHCTNWYDSFNHLSAQRDYSSFNLLLAGYIIVIVNEMNVWTSRCASVWSEIKQIWHKN